MEKIAHDACNIQLLIEMYSLLFLARAICVRCFVVVAAAIAHTSLGLYFFRFLDVSITNFAHPLTLQVTFDD